MNHRNIILSILMTATAGYVPVTTAMLSKELSEEKIEARKKAEEEKLSLYHSFFQACLRGDLKTVKNHVNKKNIDINFYCEGKINNKRPLHLACEKGHFDVVECLLDNGALINVKTDEGLTPLHLASARGHLKVVQYLIKKKPDEINVLSSEGFTPLHEACLGGSLQVVDYLIKNNADVHAISNQSITPLYFACQEGHEEIVKLLLENKANKEVPSFQQATPLHIACYQGRLNVVRILINNGASLTARTRKEYTVLHVACCNNRLDIVKLLIEKDRSLIYAIGVTGDTPLHIAVSNGDLATVEYLLRSDAHINLENSAGLTALNYACDKKNEEIIKLLGSYGAWLTTEKKAHKNQKTFLEKLNQEPQDGKLGKKNQKRKLAKTLKKISSTNVCNDYLDTTQSENQLPIENKIDEAPAATVVVDNQHIVPDLTKKVEPTTSTSTLSDLTNIDSSRFPSSRITIKISSKQKVEPKKTLVQKSKPECERVNPACYQILIHEKFTWPKSLNKKQQKIMLDHVKQLKEWPKVTELDIKELKLKGQGSVYRLRVGGHRVIFSVDTEKHEIKIHEIGLRKSVYKNMKINLS